MFSGFGDLLFNSQTSQCLWCHLKPFLDNRLGFKIEYEKRNLSTWSQLMAFIDCHFWTIELVLTTALVVPKQLKRSWNDLSSCSLEVFLSNNLMALARLGGRTMSCVALNIVEVDNACSDYLGGFYRSELRRANLNFYVSTSYG